MCSKKVSFVILFLARYARTTRDKEAFSPKGKKGLIKNEIQWEAPSSTGGIVPSTDIVPVECPGTARALSSAARHY